MSQLEVALDILARATTLLVLLAGFVGFLCREKVKQVLKRTLLGDIETIKHDFAKELAEHSAQLQREMEAYKVSLIAESERAKAAQEVKKSLALRMADRRFSALAALLDALGGYDVHAVSTVSIMLEGPADVTEKRFGEERAKAFAQDDQVRDASRAAVAFMTPDAYAKLLSIRGNAVRLLVARAAHAQPAIQSDDPRSVALLAETSALEDLLREALLKLERGE